MPKKQKSNTSTSSTFGALILLGIIGYFAYQALIAADKAITAPPDPTAPITLESIVTQQIDYNILSYGENDLAIGVRFKWTYPDSTRLNLIDYDILQATCAARNFGYQGRQEYRAIIELTDPNGNITETDGLVALLFPEEIQALNCDNILNIKLAQVATYYSLHPLLEATAEPTTRPTSLPLNTGDAPCTCTTETYNCDDFPLSNGTTSQACFDYCQSQGRGDVHTLDRDTDNLVCEG